MAEIRLIPPTLSNLVHQDASCTDCVTILDFKFSKNELLTRLEVGLVPSDFTGADPSKNARAVSEEAKPFELGNNTFKGYVVLDSNDQPGVQRVSSDAVRP